MIIEKTNRLIIIISGVVLFLLILSFSLRNIVLNYFVSKKIHAFELKYNTQLHADEIKFTGFNWIELRNLWLQHENTDTLLKIELIDLKFSLLSAVFGKVNIKEFVLKNTFIDFVRNDSTDNYLYLLKNTSDTTSANKTTQAKKSARKTVNYQNMVKNLMSLIFNIIPSKVEIRSLNMYAELDDQRFSFHLDSLSINKRKFENEIKVFENGKLMLWDFTGEIDPGKKYCSFYLQSKGRQKVQIPYLEKKYDLKLQFSDIGFSIRSLGNQQDYFSIGGSIVTDGLIIRQPRIALSDVNIDNIAFNYQFNFGNDYIELDKSTSIVFNKLNIHPHVIYYPAPERVLIARLDEQNVKSDDFFTSLPSGLFTQLSGIKTTGELTYHFKTIINFDKPDSAILESKLSKTNFRIKHYGNANLSEINSDFTYYAYESGKLQRTIEVSPWNSNFRYLYEIPESLRNAVLLSEDGQFFYHRGFNLEAFRQSIVENIKKKKFARGGSTISMQLVKNVFLNRNKTISRKLEEMIIVWLIENNSIVTKERMFEVYLNIIEWGPMIYGANEAAHYYFNKDVSRLSLAESIFLASIIPRPKKFKYIFESNGNFKDYILNYYKQVSSKMLSKQMITQEQYDYLFPHVTLTGKARELLWKPETNTSDSIEYFLENEVLF